MFLDKIKIDINEVLDLAEPKLVSYNLALAQVMEVIAY